MACVPTYWSGATSLAGLNRGRSFGMDDVAARLARNVRSLRESRGVTQAQMAKLADLPRRPAALVREPRLTRRDRLLGRGHRATLRSARTRDAKTSGGPDRRRR